MYGIPASGAVVQCPDCKRWFDNENFKVNHLCIERKTENMHMSKRRD